MTTQEPVLASLRSARREGTLAPYLALLLTPLFFIVLAPGILSSRPDCGSDEPWWTLADFELALLPLLADFAPLLWLLSSSGNVRPAAVRAGLLGACRYAAVQGLTLYAHSASGGQEGDPDCTLSIFFLVALSWLLVVLWLGSMVIAGILLMKANALRTSR